MSIYGMTYKERVVHEYRENLLYGGMDSEQLESDQEDGRQARIEFESKKFNCEDYVNAILERWDDLDWYMYWALEKLSEMSSPPEDIKDFLNVELVLSEDEVKEIEQKVGLTCGM